MAVFMCRVGGTECRKREKVIGNLSIGDDPKKHAQPKSPHKKESKVEEGEEEEGGGGGEKGSSK